MKKTSPDAIPGNENRRKRHVRNRTSLASVIGSFVGVGQTILLFVMLALFALDGEAQLRRVVYTPSDAIVPNPERGLFIGLESTIGERPLTHQQLERYRSANVTLINRYYYLTPHLHGPLTKASLEFLRQDMRTIRGAGMKTILKFAYNRNPRQPVDPDIGTMLQHLDQLKPFFEENSDVIATLQAGFIGSWGEWAFSSRGYQDSARVQNVLIRKLLEVIPKDRMICIRTVRHRYAIFGKSTMKSENAFDGSDRSRVGFHNDGYLKSWDDAGTFYLTGAARDTAETKKYMAEETRYVVMGGESSGPSGRTTCATALDEFRRFHYSYFNRMFEKRVIESFKAGGCWDEIERRLGYRFSLTRGEYSANASPGGSLRIRIGITNTGFAAPFNTRPVELILRHTSSKKLFSANLPVDPRRWIPGTTITIDTTITMSESQPPGEYSLLISFPDPHPTIRSRAAYAIRLANDGIWESATGFNDLKAKVTISKERSLSSPGRGIPLTPKRPN